MSAGATPWPSARAAAIELVGRLEPVTLPVAHVDGLVLAEDLRAAADLPGFDTAAMDGWAVAGPGPWQVVGTLLAGRGDAVTLTNDTAVRIATGAPVPPGADAVLRREDGHEEPGEPLPRLTGPVPTPQREVRPRGQECRAGDVVATAGTLVTPPLLGLAAAAGHDILRVVPPPRVDLLVLGDELALAGLPGRGQVRDALGPMLPAWLRQLGARCENAQHVPDSREELDTVLTDRRGDLVVTTGSTARGPVDHLHAALASLGAELVVDGVAVRPGHPMLLALLPDGRPLVGLPGNPLAAVSALVTLAAPVLRALRGLPPAAVRTVRLTEGASGPPQDTRLLPLRGGAPTLHRGPAMLRGLTLADGLAVVPPGGATVGTDVEFLALPWEALP